MIYIVNRICKNRQNIRHGALSDNDLYDIPSVGSDEEEEQDDE